MTNYTNTIRFILASCLTVFAVGAAKAVMPDSGWFWNPAEGGRGVNLEIQDDKIFMSVFAYKPDGSQAWYVAGGPMSTDRTWSADLYETVGGQPIGGSPRQAGMIPRGRVSVTFTNERNAQVNLLGTTLSVTRQDWSGYGAYEAKALTGEWSTSEGDPSFPVYYSERVILNTNQVDSSGKPFVSGFRTGTSASRYPAVGMWDAEHGVFAIMVDSSTSYYTLYIFNMAGFNRAEGYSWTYKKAASPTGDGTYFLANRTKSAARVRGYNAPGVDKGAPADGWNESIDRDAIDARRATRPATKSSVEVDEAEGITRPVLDPKVVNDLAMELKTQMGN